MELQELLISGAYSPGERLRVGELVKQTGTSLTPVREAVIRLVSEHAIVMLSPRSFAVPELSIDRYNQIRLMRVSFEGLAAEHAAKHISKADIARLEKYHDSFVRAEKNKDLKEALSSNLKFHFTIYKNSRLPMLVENIEKLWSLIGPILHEFYDKMPVFYLGAEEHINAIQALKDGNEQAAGDAIRSDINRSAESVEAYIARNHLTKQG